MKMYSKFNKIYSLKIILILTFYFKNYRMSLFFECIYIIKRLMDAVNNLDNLESKTFN